MAAVASVIALMAMPTPSAFAEESKNGVEGRLATLEASVTTNKRAKDVNGLLNDVRQLVLLHENAARHPQVRSEALKLLGVLTKNSKGTEVPVAAIKALKRLADPAGSRYLRVHLKKLPRKGKASAATYAAVAAAAAIRTDDLVQPLLKLVTESKDVQLAASAVKALGHFGHSKRKRAKILRTLVDTVAKDRPGEKGRRKGYVRGDRYRHTGDLARNRWAAFSRVLPAALARLTGDDMSGADADVWIALVRENKRRLGALFVDKE